MFQPLGLRLNLLLEQLPFLPETFWCILRQNSDLSRRIRSPRTQTGAEPVDGGTNECFRRPHERLDYFETLADPSGEPS